MSPRCVLKPFSTGGSGKIICMYNHAADLPIRQAAVAGQCQKNYFYGRDLVIERALQQLEGRYAEKLRKLVGRPNEIDPADVRYLLDFAYLQQNRTELALKRRMQMMMRGHEAAMRGFEGIEGAEIPPPNEDLRHHARENIRIWTEGRELLRDLTVMIVHNLTREKFLISDHPAVLLNRLHQQRCPGKSFGLITSGTQIFMPLTPEFCLVAYDPDVYSAPGRNGLFMRVEREKDILALNELQFVNCDKNLYFSRWEDEGRVKQRFIQCAANRVAEPVKLWIGIEAGRSERGIEYRRATEEDMTAPGARMISQSIVYPQPKSWFSGLAFRANMTGYYNGAAVGIVRHAFVEQHLEAGLRPVLIDQRLLNELSSDPETGYLRENAEEAA